MPSLRLLTVVPVSEAAATERGVCARYGVAASFSSRSTKPASTPNVSSTGSGDGQIDAGPLEHVQRIIGAAGFQELMYALGRAGLAVQHPPGQARARRRCPSRTGTRRS